MIMTGTLANAGLVIAGTAIGLLVKKGIKEEINHAVQLATGLAVFVIGANGVITSMVAADPVTGKLSSSGELLLVFSLILGVVVGELLRIEDRLNGLGDLVEAKLKLSGFAVGFVNASLIFCVGAMAIMGSIQDGLKGDPSILITKGVIDGITSIVLTASMGIGVGFSAVPILVYQGALTLLAGILSPYLQGDLLNEICAVGYVCVACIGVNFLAPEKRIRVANFLPGLLVPVFYHLIASLF